MAQPKSSKLKSAFKEVYSNTPKTVKKAGVTGEKKRKMLIAIAFSKARQGK